MSVLKATKLACEARVIDGQCGQMPILSYTPPNKNEIMLELMTVL